MSEPTLILHGGASLGPIEPDRLRLLRDKIRHVLDGVYDKLVRSNALEAVIEAVRLLEDDPEFNAGTGAVLQADGAARLSASVMDGGSMRFAGVINIEGILNPVLAAEQLLDERFSLLSGKGAYDFARSRGIPSGDPRTPAALEKWRRKRNEGGTVGACALDAAGNLAAATSTGGTGFETPGRVSDSATPAGNYADAFCAVSATGVGEDILREGLAVRIATRVEDGLDIGDAFRKTFEGCTARGRRLAAVGVDSRGQVAWAKTTERLLYGFRKGDVSGLFP